MNYFTSDLHFNDAPTLKVDHRPFKTTKAFDKYILKLWNKQAGKNDTIYVLGDFVDCDGEGHDGWKKSIQYVKKVKAKVVLIIGNNEERVIKAYFNNDFEAFRQYCLNLGFKEVYKSFDLKVAKVDFHLVHKPIHCKLDQMNLFGHMHRGGGIYKPFGFNIGCDLNHFYLYSEKDIKFLLTLKKDFWENDKNINLWRTTNDNK